MHIHRTVPQDLLVARSPKPWPRGATPILHHGQAEWVNRVCIRNASCRQGAQERLVPVTNGSFPEAPDGGHKSHVGTLLDAVPVALPDDPAELAEEAAFEAPDIVPVVPPPEADRVAPVLGADPAVALPVAVDDGDCVVVAGVVFAPVVVAVGPAVLLPSVTTPRFVTP
jgi:hypothetical protein